MTKPIPSSTTRKPYSFGPLYDLLVETFPDYRTKQGVFDIPKLAKGLGVSNESVYRIVRKDRISLDMAEKIILLSREEAPILPLVPENLIPFLFSPEILDA